jgi:hypothetical protein
MSQPEVKDITFDRPDYTAGSFIVFVGQNYEVAPPGPYWARKAYNKLFIFSGDVSVGTTLLLYQYTVPAGKTLFITDVVVINTGTGGGGDPRYPSTGYYYTPSTPQTIIDLLMSKKVGTQETTIDWIVINPSKPVEHKMYQTPLTFYAGDILKIYAEARMGNSGIRMLVMGYETTP